MRSFNLDRFAHLGASWRMKISVRGLSVTSSMMRQPWPASVDFDNISENSIQFVDDESVPVHLPESLNFADHGFHLPDFEDKPCDSDFQNGSGSIPGVDLAGLKARREQEGSVPGERGI